jgi:hypothetical protein
MPSPAHLYDALDAQGVTIRACAPVGLVSNLGERWFDLLLQMHTLGEVAETLLCRPERLVLEMHNTGSLPEAFALILEEKVRGGVFRFSDLLVSYLIGPRSGMLISPTTEQACIAILESKGGMA